MRRYIIIGMGPAGICAVEAIRSIDPSGQITLIGDELHGYYSRPGLAYYLTGELPEKQLFPFYEADFAALKLKRLTSRVSRILPEAHQIELDGGGLLPYDRLLIATGATAVEPKVDGLEAQGVVKLDNLDDARRILKLARKARSAVVVGGGITALEITEGLVARGVKVHYLLRGDRYWSNVLDETESKIVEHRLKEDGVILHYNTDMEEILIEHSQVRGIRTRDGRQIRCEIFAYAIGVRPRTGLAQSAELEMDRGILVDEYLRTSKADIFAAGDVAQVYDPFSGKSVLDSLWGPASEQGRLAGLNMAGQVSPYCKAVAINVTRLANLTTTIIGMVGRGVDLDLVGIVHGDSETFRQLPDAIAAQADFDVNRLRIMTADNKLIGAIVMGDQTLSHAVQYLVANQVDISPIRDQILRPNAPLADIIADFWTQYSTNGTRRSKQP